VVVVDVSTGEEVRPEGESEEVDRLASLPAKAYPFQVMASRARGLAVEEAIGVVEWAQRPEMKQCSPHNLTMRSHCWSQFLFWVHLQCWKFLKEDPFAAAAAVVVVEVGASQGGAYDISLALHLFLSWLC